MEHALQKLQQPDDKLLACSESAQHWFSQTPNVEQRSSGDLRRMPEQSLRLKVSLLGSDHKVVLSLFCILLSGRSPPKGAFREPVGVDWGIRRLHNQ